jgi:hypothetical protein
LPVGYHDHAGKAAAGQEKFHLCKYSCERIVKLEAKEAKRAKGAKSSFLPLCPLCLFCFQLCATYAGGKFASKIRSDLSRRAAK